MIKSPTRRCLAKISHGNSRVSAPVDRKAQEKKTAQSRNEKFIRHSCHVLQLRLDDSLDLSQIIFQSTAHPTDSGGDGHNELKKQEKS